MSPSSLQNVSPSPFQHVAAFAGNLFLFLVVSRTPDFIGVSGVALAVGLVALTAIFLSGGIVTALSSRAGIFLVAFSIWLCVCTIFSVWRGGSVELMKETWSRSLLAFVIVGGSLFTVAQLQKAMYAGAIAAMAIMTYAFLFASAASGRLAFQQGTLANPNDLAAFLLLTVPFCFFGFLESKNVIVKVAMVVVILVLLGMALRTGSRSGLVSIGILAVYLFFSASIPKKFLMVLTTIVLIIASPIYLPESVLARFRTVVSDEPQVISDAVNPEDRQADFAEGSTKSRTQLLLKSIDFTIANPLFGVGPGMFAVAASDLAKEEGVRAMWQQTHNTYTQVSSETGLPGLLIYMGLIYAIFRGTRIPPWVKLSDPDTRVLRNVSFTLRLSLIAFCGGAMFGSLAYGMHLPLLAGLAETLRRVMAAKRYQTPAPVPAWTPRQTQPLRLAGPRMKA